MKKFFAALLAISITAALAGCGKNADGQTAEGTFSGTVSETITTTATEMLTEAVSETKETTEAAETITENYAEPENIFADYDESKFPMGRWQDNHIFRYTGNWEHNIDYIEIPDYYNYTESDMYTYEEWLTSKNQVPYEFDGEGHYRISMQTHDVLGKYTFEDNVLTLIFDIEFHNGEKFYTEVCFDIVKEENGYRLYYKAAESGGTLNVPVITDKEDISSDELSGGLSALFSDFTERESFFLKYAGESDPNSLKNFMEYIEDISQ